MSSELISTSKPSVPIKTVQPPKTTALKRSLSAIFQMLGTGKLTMVSHLSRTKDLVAHAGPSLQLVLSRHTHLSTMDLSIHLLSNSSLTALVTLITTDATVVFHHTLSSISTMLAVSALKKHTHTTLRIEIALLTHLLSLYLFQLDLSTLLRETKMN